MQVQVQVRKKCDPRLPHLEERAALMEQPLPYPDVPPQSDFVTALDPHPSPP